MTVLLFDGNNIFYRGVMAPGSEALRNSRGHSVGGLLRMWLKLRSLFRQPEIATTKGVLVMDPVRARSWRRMLDPGYKGNRSEPNEIIMSQLQELENLAHAFGLGFAVDSYLEADDVLATLAKRWINYSPIVISGDKDMAALANDRVKVWDPYKIEFVKTKHSDALVLSGDTADCIPGIAGFGMIRAEQALAGRDAIAFAHELTNLTDVRLLALLNQLGRLHVNLGLVHLVDDAATPVTYRGQTIETPDVLPDVLKDESAIQEFADRIEMPSITRVAKKPVRAAKLSNAPKTTLFGE